MVGVNEKYVVFYFSLLVYLLKKVHILAPQHDNKITF